MNVYLMVSTYVRRKMFLSRSNLRPVSYTHLVCAICVERITLLPSIIICLIDKFFLLAQTQLAFRNSFPSKCYKEVFYVACE